MAPAETVGDPSSAPFAALGDPHRRRILSLLGDQDLSVAEIAAALPISRPAVSRHLRLLKDAVLVTEAPQGTRRIYRLQAEVRDEAQARAICGGLKVANKPCVPVLPPAH